MELRIGGRQDPLHLGLLGDDPLPRRRRARCRSIDRAGHDPAPPHRLLERRMEQGVHVVDGTVLEAPLPHPPVRPADVVSPQLFQASGTDGRSDLPLHQPPVPVQGRRAPVAGLWVGVHQLTDHLLGGATCPPAAAAVFSCSSSLRASRRVRTWRKTFFRLPLASRSSMRISTRSQILPSLRVRFLMPNTPSRFELAESSHRVLAAFWPPRTLDYELGAEENMLRPASLLEAASGIEPLYRVLQTLA